MKHWPRLHDSYIARIVATSILMTWGILIGLTVVLTFADDIGNIGKGSYTINHAIAVAGLGLPGHAYDLFPTAAVIGALLGLGELAATSELTALRALGLSRARLSVSVALVLALFTLLMVVNGETLWPWASQRAQAIRSIRHSDMVVSRYDGLWAREGNMFLSARGGEQKARAGDSWLELHGVRLFEFDPDGRLRSIANVQKAEHRGDHWALLGVDRIRFDAKSVQRSRVASERWNSRLSESVLAASVTKPGHLDSAQLRTSIDYRKRNGLDASNYERIYWGRWFYPLNVLALCLAAAPFAFGSLRSGGYGKRVFIGIVFALGFWLLQQVVTKLAGVYHFDFRIAYAVPPMIMLGVSYFVFRRRSG